MRNQKLEKVKNDNQNQDLVATKKWWNQHSLNFRTVTVAFFYSNAVTGKIL